MNKEERAARTPGTLACVLWVLAVVAAYCFTFGCSLLQYARGAAGRFPFLGRVLELLRLDQ